MDSSRFAITQITDGQSIAIADLQNLGLERDECIEFRQGRDRDHFTSYSSDVEPPGASPSSISKSRRLTGAT